MTEKYDAIVVGAGFAGIAAAREFGAKNLRTLVLEGRDRVGGRTHTVMFGGRQVEMGGTWVHWNQPHIWAELTRYGIAVSRDEWAFESVVLGNPPTKHEPAHGFAELRRVFETFVGEYATALPLPHAPAHELDLAREVDTLSVQERLAQIGFTDTDRAIAESLLYEIAGGPFENASFLTVVRWMALCGWNVNEWYETCRYRPEGGTSAIVQAMLDDSGADLQLDSAVTAVRTDVQGVRVETSDGGVYRADRVVVAVPVNLWSSIDFLPALPHSQRTLAADGVGKPVHDKLWIWARGEALRPVFGQLPAPAPINFFWTTHVDGDRHLLVGINTNHELDVNDPEAVAAVFRKHIPEIEEVLEVRSHSWGNDRFSRGGNSCPRPEQLELLESVRNITGPVAFAGADVARGWFGYIDGAIESGIHAARSLIQPGEHVAPFLTGAANA